MHCMYVCMYVRMCVCMGVCVLWFAIGGPLKPVNRTIAEIYDRKCPSSHWNGHRRSETRDRTCKWFVSNALDRQKLNYTCLKKCTNFETVLLKNTRIDFDDILLKCSKDCRMKFACFIFHEACFFIDFSSIKSDTDNNANFDAVSSKRAH